MKLIKANNIDWCTNETGLDLPNECFFRVDNSFDCRKDLVNTLEEYYKYPVNYAEYTVVAETKEKLVLEA
jgi:hypothetical protein